MTDERPRTPGADVRRHRRCRTTFGRNRLPARHRNGHSGIPRRPAGQAVVGGGARRRRQDRIGPRGRAGDGFGSGAAAVLRGCRRGPCPLRVEPRQADPAHPGRLRRLGPDQDRRVQRGVPADASTADRDPAHRADGAADRRDRQGRHRDRGPAAGGAQRLRGDRAGTGHDHRRAHTVRPADLQRHPRAVRGAQAPLPVPAHRLPRSRTGAAHSVVPGAGVARAPRRGTGAHHRRAARHATQETAVGGRDHRLGRARCWRWVWTPSATRRSRPPSAWCSNTNPTRSRRPAS